MTASQFLATAFTTLLSAAALAQEAPPAATEAAPAVPECCVVQGAPHDHGAGTGTRMPTMDGCPMAATTASAAPAKAKAKAKPAHDHSKFHKLM